MDDRLQELEMKVAFQDDEIEKLKASMDEQQRALYKLVREMDELRERMESRDEEAVIDAADEAPPPHY